MSDQDKEGSAFPSDLQEQFARRALGEIRRTGHSIFVDDALIKYEVVSRELTGKEELVPDQVADLQKARENALQALRDLVGEANVSPLISAWEENKEKRRGDSD